MLLKGEVQMIHKMLREGISKNEIARRLGIHRNTVRKYSNFPEGYTPIIKRRPAITIVDPYLLDIVRMLEEAHKLQVHIPISAVCTETRNG